MLSVCHLWDRDFQSSVLKDLMKPFRGCDEQLCSGTGAEALFLQQLLWYSVVASAPTPK